MPSSRWQSVDGSNQVCRSCDTSQRFEEPQTTNPPRIMSTAAWPTRTTQESSVKGQAGHPSATYVRYRPEVQIKAQKSPAKFMKRDADRKGREYNLFLFCINAFKHLKLLICETVKSFVHHFFFCREHHPHGTHCCSAI